MRADHLNQSSLPAALLWDFDGTLVDSEDSWFAAEVRLMAEWGLSWSHEQAEMMVGNALVESARVMLDYAGREGDVEFYAHVLNTYALEDMMERGTPMRPGAAELITEARAAGIRCALVSATFTPVLEAVTTHFPDGWFDVVIGGDQVVNGKPHPEPYLTAAARLGVDHRHCVAFEDSLPGTGSALAAGIVTIGVPFKQQLTPRPGLVLRDTLAGLTLTEVSHIWQEERR